MKILVALKQVPDTETKIKIAPDGKTLDLGDAKWITSPYDEYALEEALRLKEAQGAEVTAATVGGDKAKPVLQGALALGVNTAVLIKAEVGEDQGFDLILLGNKGFGGDNASVGPMLAELLGMAQANVVTRLEVADGGFKAEREADAGTEIIEGTLPAVVTAQRGLNEPRYANLKGIMAAKKKTIEEVAGASPAAQVRVAALEPPPTRPEGRKLEGDPAAQAAALLGLLRDEAKIL